MKFYTFHIVHTFLIGVNENINLRQLRYFLCQDQGKNLLSIIPYRKLKEKMIEFFQEFF